MLLSDFNEDEDIVMQFDADNIAKTLSSEDIFLIAMYVMLICLVSLLIIIKMIVISDWDKNCTLQWGKTIE